MIPGTSAMDRPVEKPKGLSRRAIVLGAAALFVLVGAGFAVPSARRWARSERVADGSRLRIATVVRGDLERDVSAQGRIVAALHPTLFSPAQGTVTLAVKAGSEVKKGQLLAKVDSPELVSRVTQERATLLSLQSDLGRQRIATRQAEVRNRQSLDLLALREAAAARALERAQSLFQQGLLNKTDYEKAQDDLKVATLELKNARETSQLEKDTLEFEVKNRQLLVDRQDSVVRDLQRQATELTVSAPFDGMVANVAVQDRDAVSRNQALLTVVNLSAFEVEFDIPENYAADVIAGTPAEILYEGKTYAGKVTAVSPEIRDSQVRGTVVFAGEPPAGLRQSQRVTTRLVLEHKNAVLKVTRGPFLESGGGRSAYVVEGGVATRREVQMGATSVAEVEVVGGLREGDRVVVSDTSVFEGARTVLIRD